jgi:hypothetical protein
MKNNKHNRSTIEAQQSPFLTNKLQIYEKEKKRKEKSTYYQCDVMAM